jgi:hypothetical protein
MTDLSSLIARLEKAEGPSREIDVEIMNTVDPRSPDEKRLFDGQIYPASWGAVGQICDQIRYFVEAPCLTSSIDAAVSLAERVLRGWTIAAIGQDDRKGWHAELREGHRTAYSTVTLAGASNGATALVLATLRALQQKGSSNG